MSTPLRAASSPQVTFATYLSYRGGAGNETAAGVKVDAVGNLYVVGTTTTGLANPSIFVTKLAPAGQQVLSSLASWESLAASR